MHATIPGQPGPQGQDGLDDLSHEAASIRLLTNALPGLTTVAAWCRRPKRESKSIFVVDRRGVIWAAGLIHEVMVDANSSSFS